MKNIDYSELEKQMLNFDFKALESEAAVVRTALSGKADIAGGLEKLCAVWHKIAPFIRPLERIPVVGKYIEILAGLLDTICPK